MSRTPALAHHCPHHTLHESEQEGGDGGTPEHEEGELHEEFRGVVGKRTGQREVLREVVGVKRNIWVCS